jgi:hypothetical protein
MFYPLQTVWSRSTIQVTLQQFGAAVAGCIERRWAEGVESLCYANHL